MNQAILSIAAFIIILTGCGPSKEQIATEERRKLDSALAVGHSLLLPDQTPQPETAADAARQEILKTQFVELKAQLVAEEAKLDNINQFIILRNEAEKEQQIADQATVVENLKSQIEDTRKQLGH